MTNYRLHVLRTWKNKQITDEQITNAVMGIAGEAGEICDMWKKVMFHKHPLDKAKLLNEIGDVRYYLEVLTYMLGETMENIEELNIDKLNKRYPNGFSVEDSINRTE